ncbi:MAG: condensation domain-containing protein, partial [Tumebacillaceae bacterium]
LGEIEARMLEHDAVLEVLLTVVEESDGDKLLCAYYTKSGEITEQELRTYLGDRLPAFMVPTYLMQLDEMPMTPNKKIDRKALPHPKTRFDQEATVAQPTTETEKQLAELWAELLDVKEIGVEGDFFALGGHSLRAAKLAAQVQVRFEVKLPLAMIFQYPTLGQLAAYIAEAKQQAVGRIPVLEPQEAYEVSAAQERMIILAQLEEGTTTYNMPVAVMIHGEFDVDRLHAALNGVIARHETLRTTFEVRERESVQIIHPQLTLDLPVQEGAEEEIEAILSSFVQPFDLSKAPLLRARLVRLAPDKHLFLFDQHHIISDGVSTNLLIQDLLALYEGETLPPLRVQYKEFAAWQNDSFFAERLSKQEEYWLDHMQGTLPVLDLPTDFSRPSVKTYAGAALTFELGSEVTTQLTAFAQEQGATLYMTLLAAYNVLLFKYTGQDDIIVGSPIAGRSQAELETIMGLFVNTLAMRNRPVHTKTFREFLAEVKENALQAYEHQEYPFDRLVNQLGWKPNSERHPLFDTMFTLQNLDRPQMQLGTASVVPYALPSQTAKFDLLLSGFQNDEGLAFVVEYSTELFAPERIERMAQHFVYLLTHLVSLADEPIVRLPLEKEDDRKQPVHYTLGDLDFDF